jgi:TRAP-type C4-dicarboxylate transport system permease small subunit
LSDQNPQRLIDDPAGSLSEAGRVADASSGKPQFEDHLAVAAMAILMLITFANVLVRYFTDQSFAWTEEISSVLMLVMTLVAAAAASARDQHIRIENFSEAGSFERRRRLALLSAGTTWIVFVVLAVLGLRMAWDEYRFEETSPGIGIAKWLYSIWLPILCALIARRAAGRWARVRRWRPDDPVQPQGTAHRVSAE